MTPRAALYFDKLGQPINAAEWAPLLNDAEYRLVEYTELPAGGWVSTVWLGLDHNWGDGPPLIFESLDFPARDHLRRYSTIEEARAGHREVVALSEMKP